MLAGRSAERCACTGADCPLGPAAPSAAQACDITGERAVANMIEQVLADCGRLDVLMINAGIQARGTLEEVGVAALRACLEGDVAGTWLARYPPRPSTCVMRLHLACRLTCSFALALSAGRFRDRYRESCGYA